MKTVVKTGEFCAAMKRILEESVDGDIILLPSDMHLHAFSQVQEQIEPKIHVTLQVIKK